MGKEALGETVLTISGVTVGTLGAGYALVDLVRLNSIPADIAHSRLYQELDPKSVPQGSAFIGSQERRVYQNYVDQAFTDMGGYGRGLLDTGLLTASAFVVIFGPRVSRFIANRVGMLSNNIRSIYPRILSR